MISNSDGFNKLRAQDRKLLLAIAEAPDSKQLASRVFEYYHDTSRAYRTSHNQMFLHIGMLVGAITQLTERIKKLEKAG